MSSKDIYENPLVTRNASPEMCRLFSPRQRILTWRRIWLALAESQAGLGLPVTQRELNQLRRTIDKIDFEAAAGHEKRLRHDVMAHLHAWGDLAPGARGILHLGATSMDVVDNADLILMRKAAPPHVKLKAAGGVRDLDGAIAVARLGCDRIGASRTAEILDALRARPEGREAALHVKPPGSGPGEGY